MIYKIFTKRLHSCVHLLLAQSMLRPLKKVIAKRVVEKRAMKALVVEVRQKEHLHIRILQLK